MRYLEDDLLQLGAEVLVDHRVAAIRLDLRQSWLLWSLHDELVGVRTHHDLLSHAQPCFNCRIVVQAEYLRCILQWETFSYVFLHGAQIRHRIGHPVPAHFAAAFEDLEDALPKGVWLCQRIALIARQIVWLNRFLVFKMGVGAFPGIHALLWLHKDSLVEERLDLHTEDLLIRLLCKLTTIVEHTDYVAEELKGDAASYFQVLAHLSEHLDRDLQVIG